MSDFTITEKSRVKRHPERGHYDRSTVYEIIDEALICHVGFVQEGQPMVIPTLHARKGDHLLLHGASSSRLIREIANGFRVCINIVLVDGIVLAKSVFNQSVNYRSVVLWGQGRLIEEPAEKLAALELFTERIMPGRWADARRPTENELKATGVVAIPIDDASAKVRTGPPKDDDEDLDLPIWAGVMPMSQGFHAPLRADYSDEAIPVPGYVIDRMS